MTKVRSQYVAVLHIDMLERGVTVNLKRMWQKLSGSAEPKELTIQDKILELIRKEAGNATDGTQQAALVIAEIVLPQVVKNDTEFDSTKCREWAVACGKIIGFLAGVAVDADKQDKAINKILDESKNMAAIFGMLRPRKPGTKLVTQPSGSVLKAAATVKKSSSSAASLEYKRGMIKDLETQVMIETEPTAKSALQAMADRIKKELELEQG